MAKTKTDKIASIEEQIAQLENQRKQLQQQQKEQERKDRTKRLCRRMGLLESLLPDTIPLTDEQFQTLLEKTILTEQSRRILEGLTTQNATTTAPQTAAQGNAAPISKTTATAQQSHEDEGADEDGFTRVTG